MSDAEGEWRSLEPASVFVNLIPDLGRTIRSLWYILVPVLLGGTTQGAVDLGFLVIFFGMAVARTVVHFATLRYRIHGGKLEVVVGLIGRRHRLVDPARIQNIEIVQNLFHRMAGLVELRVDTAGEVGADGMLSAISVAEAERLRAELAALRGRVGGAVTVEQGLGEELGRIGLLELFGFGVSAGGIGSSLLVVGVGLDLVGQLGGATANQVYSHTNPYAAVGFGLVLVAVTYLGSVAQALLRWYGFRLLRGERGIATEAGLLTRRRVEIPPRKVQVLRVDEPVLRRLMGYGTVQIETAASPVPGAGGAGEAMIPMVPTEDLAPTMGLILPGMPADAWDAPLTSAAPRALFRALVWATVRWGILVAALVASGSGAWPALFFVWGWVAAFLDWRVQGWRLTKDFLVTRRGFPTRRTWYVPRDKIQSVHADQGPLMRNYRLRRVTVWVAGTRVSVPDLTEADADELFAALSVARAVA